MKIWIEATDFAGAEGSVDRRAIFPPTGFLFHIVPDTVLSKSLLAKQKRIRRQFAALIEREKGIGWVQGRMRTEAEGNLTDIKRVRQLFAKLDVSPKDGKLTKAEYGKAESFAKLDKNGDGVLTLADWGGEWKLGNDDATQLGQLEAEQRRIMRATMRLAEGLIQIREEMENNRLDRDGTGRANLNKTVIGPMRALADRQMNRLASALEAIAKMVGEQPLEPIDEAIDLTAEILVEMGEILRHMEWSELFDDVVTRMRSIYRLQQEMRRLTEEQHRKMLESQLPEEDGEKKKDGDGDGDGDGDEKKGDEEKKQ